MEDKSAQCMHAFRIASQDIVSEIFDGEVVVLNLATGRYFGFNPSATVIWEALTAGALTADIETSLSASDQLKEFIGDLLANSLLAPEPSPSDLSPEMRRRLSECVGVPVVETYDDLADLIVADPIHDVDEEAGWPVRSVADG